MTLGLLLALISTQDSPIELERGVVRLADIVQTLASKSHEDLSTDAILKNQVLYLNLKPRPAKALMTLIADCVGGEWVRKDTSAMLVRSPEKRRMDIADERRQAIEAVSKFAGLEFAVPHPKLDATTAGEVIKRYNVIYQQDEGPDVPESKQRRTMMSLTPIGRALLDALSPSALPGYADIPIGVTRFYATFPGRRIRPIPGFSPARLKQLQSEEKAIANSLLGMEVAAREEVGFPYSSELLRTRLAQPPTVVFRVGRSSPTNFDFSMTALDEKGEEIESDYLEGYFDFQDVKPNLPGYAAWRTKPIQGSPPAEEIRRLFERFIPENPYRAAFLDPVKVEPLKTMAENGLNALTKAMERDCIALLPDSAGLFAWQFSSNKWPLGEFVRYLSDSMRWETRDDLVVGLPLFRNECIEQRLNRVVLRDLLQKTAAVKRMPTLEELADYVTKQPDHPSIIEFESPCLMGASVCPESCPAFESLADERLSLRLYGQLTPFQRRALASGEGLALAQLPPAARALLERLVFDQQGSLIVQDAAQISSQIALTPSYVFPDGFDASTTLRARVTREPYVYSDYDNQLGSGISAEGLAFGVFRQESGTLLGELREDYRNTKYLPVTGLNFYFRVWLSATAVEEFSLFGTEMQPGGPSTSYDKLPGAHGEAFRKMLEKQRKLAGGG